MKKFITLVFVASTPAFAVSPAGKVTQVNLSVECDSGYCDLVACSVTQFSSLNAQRLNSNGKLVSTAASECEPWAYLADGVGGDATVLLSTSQSGECIEKLIANFGSKNWAPSKRGCSFGN